MRVIERRIKQPLNLLAIGTRGHIAAASSMIGATGEIDIWELASGNHILNQTVNERRIECLGFTPDGNHLLITTDEAIAILNLTNGEVTSGPILMLGYPSFAISATSDTHGRLFVEEHVNQYTRISCWEFSKELEFRQLWNEGPLSHLYFESPTISREGKLVAVVLRSQEPRGTASERIYVRDAADGAIRFQISGDSSNPIQQLKFTEDGSFLLTRASGRSIKIFDATKDGSLAGELVHPGRPYVTGMANHPSGLVATCRSNGTVCFWNVVKKELVRTLDWKLGKLVSVAFSPDGYIGAAGTERGQVILWDMDE